MCAKTSLGRGPPGGLYGTLSMATAESAQASEVLKKRLPKYPMPVALIGRLAIDRRAQRRRLGEKLLMDALRRVVDAANILGCIGIIVDAKDVAGIPRPSRPYLYP